jgi:uncharacterized SAM-binding protein YcdF (DUF218 family)
MNSLDKFIILISNETIKKSNAIILLEGDGINRVNHAIWLYKNKYANKIVFSGNIINYEYGSYPISDIQPLLLKSGVKKEDILHENTSKNTHEQALEVVNIAKNNSWNKIILVASHYHQYRAYLTFLKVILETYPSLIMFNSPVRNLNWFEDLIWGKRFELLELEFKKIKEYKNHVASFEKAVNYHKWKETQP